MIILGAILTYVIVGIVIAGYQDNRVNGDIDIALWWPLWIFYKLGKWIANYRD